MWVVTGWRRLRGLPLAPADLVASLVASLVVSLTSGQNLASVHDLLVYKREATCEYSFGFVFFLSPSAVCNVQVESFLLAVTLLVSPWGSHHLLPVPTSDPQQRSATRRHTPNSDVGQVDLSLSDVGSLSGTGPKVAWGSQGV